MDNKTKHILHVRAKFFKVSMFRQSKLNLTPLHGILTARVTLYMASLRW